MRTTCFKPKRPDGKRFTARNVRYQTDVQIVRGTPAQQWQHVDSCGHAHEVIGFGGMAHGR